jgi:predicted Zn-dependent peptidase
MTGPCDELPADAAIPDDLDVTIDTLANGLTYYIRHNDRPDGRAELRLVVDADRVDGVDELEDFADQGAALQRLTIDDVRAFVARYLPADQYIEITVLPR